MRPFKFAIVFVLLFWAAILDGRAQTLEQQKERILDLLDQAQVSRDCRWKMTNVRLNGASLVYQTASWSAGTKADHYVLHAINLKAVKNITVSGDNGEVFLNCKKDMPCSQWIQKWVDDEIEIERRYFDYAPICTRVAPLLRDALKTYIGLLPPKEAVDETRRHYFALAISDETRAWGVGSSRGSLSEASRIAMSICRRHAAQDERCAISLFDWNTCFALYKHKKAWGATTRNTAEEARRGARRQCGNENCAHSHSNCFSP